MAPYLTACTLLLHLLYCASLNSLSLIEQYHHFNTMAHHNHSSSVVCHDDTSQHQYINIQQSNMSLSNKTWLRNFYLCHWLCTNSIGKPGPFIFNLDECKVWIWIMEQNHIHEDLLCKKSKQMKLLMKKICIWKQYLTSHGREQQISQVRQLSFFTIT